MPNIFEHVIKFFTPKKKASILNTFLFLERGKLADKELVSLALKVPYVVSAVELISNAVANLPFKYNNSRAEELLMNPNPEQSQMEFFKELTTDLLLFGNAYVYLNTVRNNIKELWLLEPYAITVVDNGQEIVRYEMRIGSNSQVFTPEQICHIKIPNPTDPFSGRSILRSIELTIQQYVYTKEWNANLMKNGARPLGAFVTQENLTKEEFEELKNQVSLQFSGKTNAGKPLVLEGGLDWKEISISPRELDWLESLKSLIKEIAVAFGIAPELLGDSENKTYSNFTEARKQLYYNTVLPLSETIIYELNKAFARYMNISFEIDYNDIDALSEDRNAVFEQATRGAQAGVLTINEAREMLGLPKIQGGDQIFMNASLMPMLAGFDEKEME